MYKSKVPLPPQFRKWYPEKFPDYVKPEKYIYVKTTIENLQKDQTCILPQVGQCLICKVSNYIYNTRVDYKIDNKNNAIILGKSEEATVLEKVSENFNNYIKAQNLKKGDLFIITHLESPLCTVLKVSKSKNRVVIDYTSEYITGFLDLKPDSLVRIK